MPEEPTKECGCCEGCDCSNCGCGCDETEEPSTKDCGCDADCDCSNCGCDCNEPSEEETTKEHGPKVCPWCGEHHDESTQAGFWISFVHDIRYVCASLFGFLNIFGVTVDVPGC